jgi:hypothetical protein
VVGEAAAGTCRGCLVRVGVGGGEGRRTDQPLQIGAAVGCAVSPHDSQLMGSAATAVILPTSARRRGGSVQTARARVRDPTISGPRARAVARPFARERWHALSRAGGGVSA